MQIKLQNVVLQKVNHFYMQNVYNVSTISNMYKFVNTKRAEVEPFCST